MEDRADPKIATTFIVCRFVGLKDSPATYPLRSSLLIVRTAEEESKRTIQSIARPKKCNRIDLKDAKTTRFAATTTTTTVKIYKDLWIRRDFIQISAEYMKSVLSFYGKEKNACRQLTFDLAIWTNNDQISVQSAARTVEMD